jgi:perosamine synthetase
MEDFRWPQPSKIDVQVASPWVSLDDRRAVAEALSGEWVGPNSPWHDGLERNLFQRLGQTVLLTSNGSVALMLALRALGVGPGHEVIVPALTYAATASSVVNVGATPVFCDVDLDTWSIDVVAASKLVTQRTRALIAVHPYGVSADLPALMNLCGGMDITLIEDAAEAFGGTLESQSLGTWGAVGTFSFFANKLLTTGEGGAVTSRNPELVRRMALLRGQGMDPKRRYYFLEAGFNFRMGALQAALGLSQIERFDQILADRRALETRYDQLLSGIMTRPAERPGSERAPWLYTGVVGDGHPGGTPRRLASALAKIGIETRPVFWPLPMMPAFRNYNAGPIPNASALARRGISLPTSHRVTLDVAERISTIIKGELR